MGMSGLFGWFRRRRERGDAAAAAHLYFVRGRVAATPGAALVHVLQVYQYAARGTKAIVRDDASGYAFDAWFWWARVGPGQAVAVHAGAGWGPHTQRDNVLYVGQENGASGVLEILPAGIVARAARHAGRHL
ncbi:MULTISPECIES: hypothetical protein [unclassified Pseudofrankia]|uniref:hypothetical protein n=1 Tax=unclassified Pseudofrankia TaxID=2994372 RepID=UPI001042602E|nr:MULTISPECIES: hypothetical protein [unclassified Pseudofrankia]MDT3441636.1 hypothetical protein [Pseudofrankia sp. BMG5.37]